MALKLTAEFLDRPVYTLTVRELLELNRFSEKETSEAKPEASKSEIKGIHALAEFLKVSPTTAQKLKNSGKIPFSQFGKVVRFDGNKVLEALGK